MHIDRADGIGIHSHIADRQISVLTCIVGVVPVEVHDHRVQGLIGGAVCDEIRIQHTEILPDLIVLVDGIVDTETCGDEVYRLLMLIVGIIDEAYPDIMRARFA